MNQRSHFLTSLIFLVASLSFHDVAAARSGQEFHEVEDPGRTPGRGDGVYGRFLGDFAYRLGLGMEWDFQGEAMRPLAKAEVNAYQTVGLYLSYRQGVLSSDRGENFLGLGATFSPLFLMRWSEARETGKAYWDLLVDSLTLSPGIVFATPENQSFGSAPGFELGFGAGLPFLPRANGPWLRAQFNLTTGRRALGYDHGLGSSAMLVLELQGFFFVGLLKTDASD